MDRTVTGYNRLKVKTHQREYDLIANELSEVDLMLERAEHALNWNSEGTAFKPPTLLILAKESTNTCPPMHYFFGPIIEGLTSEFDIQLRRKSHSRLQVFI